MKLPSQPGIIRPMVRFGGEEPVKAPENPVLQKIKANYDKSRQLQPLRTEAKPSLLKRFWTFFRSRPEYVYSAAAKTVGFGSLISLAIGMSGLVYNGITNDSAAGKVRRGLDQQVGQSWRDVHQWARTVQQNGGQADPANQITLQNMTDNAVNAAINTLPTGGKELNNQFTLNRTLSQAELSSTTVAVHQYMTQTRANRNLTQFLGQQTLFKHLNAESLQKMAQMIETTYGGNAAFGTNEFNQVGQILRAFAQPQYAGVDINEIAAADTSEKASAVLQKMFNASEAYKQLSQQDRATLSNHSKEAIKILDYKFTDPTLFLILMFGSMLTGMAAMVTIMRQESKNYYNVQAGQEEAKAFREQMKKCLWNPTETLQAYRLKKQLGLTLLPVPPDKLPAYETIKAKNQAMISKLNALRTQAAARFPEVKAFFDQVLQQEPEVSVENSVEDLTHQELLRLKAPQSMDQLAFAEQVNATLQLLVRNREYMPELLSSPSKGAEDDQWMAQAEKPEWAQDLDKLNQHQAETLVRLVGSRINEIANEAALADLKTKTADANDEVLPAQVKGAETQLKLSQQYSEQALALLKKLDQRRLAEQLKFITQTNLMQEEKGQLKLLQLQRELAQAQAAAAAVELDPVMKTKALLVEERALSIETPRPTKTATAP